MINNTPDELIIYEFMIFNAKQQLIYYRRFHEAVETVYDYEALNKQTNIRNSLGVAISVSHLCKQFSPTKDMVFKNFKTNQYKYNMFETPNEIRFIILSSLKDQGIDFAVLFQQLFGLYIDYVKRNMLYEQDSVIDIPKYIEATNKLFKQVIFRKKK